MAIGAPPVQNKEFMVDVYSLLGARKIIGSNAGAVKPHRDYPIWFSLYLERILPLDHLVPKTYALHNVNNAFRDMIEGDVVKPIIEF